MGGGDASGPTASEVPAAQAATSDEELVRETLRLHRRYALEIVERFSFCPYAARAREEGRTAEVVVLDAELSVARALDHVHGLAARPVIEVAFLVYPLARVDRAGLGRFVESLRRAHQAEPGGLVLTMEGFHPHGPLDLASEGRIVPFLRRTPDPTIQLTRLSSLEHVRRSVPSGTGYVDPARIDLGSLLAAPVERPVSERIAAANLATAERRAADIAAAYDAIHADHAATRARLGR